MKLRVAIDRDGQDLKSCQSYVDKDYLRSDLIRIEVGDTLVRSIMVVLRIELINALRKLDLV